MAYLLATRGAATKLRATPFTETTILGVYSVLYRPGIEPVPQSGAETSAGPLGTYARGAYRLSGIVFSLDASAAENLFSITAGIDLWIRYRSSGQKRIRKIKNVLFLGDALVEIPSRNRGVAELIGVGFRAQIPEGSTFATVVEDVLE